MMLKGICRFMSYLGNYTKIKIQERARVGQPGKPIAELTRLGWVMIFPSQESDLTNMMFSKTSVYDYENLYSLDVSGVKEEHVRRDELVYDKFKKNSAKVLKDGIKRIYSGKRNTLHLIQTNLEVWVN